MATSAPGGWDRTVARTRILGSGHRPETRFLRVTGLGEVDATSVVTTSSSTGRMAERAFDAFD